MSAYAKLSPRHKIFVDAYLRLMVGREAALVMNPQSIRPDVIAAKLRADPRIKAALAERAEEAIDRAGAKTWRVIEEVARNAFFNPKKLRDADGKLIPIHLLPDSVAAAISSEEYDEFGKTIKYRTNRKNESLKLLMQYLKILVEKHEHTGEDGGPIRTADVSAIEKARRIAFLLDAGIRATTPLSPTDTDMDEEDDVDDYDEDEEPQTPGSGG